MGLDKEVLSATTDSMTPFLLQTHEHNGKPFFLLQH